VNQCLLCRLRYGRRSCRFFYGSHAVSIERIGAYFLKESVIGRMTGRMTGG
jgi:hypothetical protein